MKRVFLFLLVMYVPCNGMQQAVVAAGTNPTAITSQQLAALQQEIVEHKNEISNNFYWQFAGLGASALTFINARHIFSGDVCVQVSQVAEQFCFSQVGIARVACVGVGIYYLIKNYNASIKHAKLEELESIKIDPRKKQ